LAFASSSSFVGLHFSVESKRHFPYLIAKISADGLKRFQEIGCAVHALDVCITSNIKLRIYLKTKKGKRDRLLLAFYGLFLSSSKPTMAIAMIIAITPIAMYIARSVVVAMFDTGVAVGAVVGAGVLTVNDVSAFEG
jgi:hypothetical protein